MNIMQGHPLTFRRSKITIGRRICLKVNTKDQGTIGTNFLAYIHDGRKIDN